MKKIKSIIVMMLLCGAGVLIGSQGADAADTAYYDSVSDGQTDQDGYYIVKADSVSKIQDALKDAKENATASKPYKVVVKPGSYKISSAFSMYSNTYLYAQGAAFKQNASGQNMVRVGSAESVLGYYYENIVIDGGEWDESNNSSTLAKFAQTKTVTVQNATFKNVKLGHLMEVAGVNGMTITNCQFMNQTIDKKSKYYEAIQLDILVDKHFNGYRSQDLANKNITVTNCTFNNVPRGVGSHTAVLNNPIDGVTVTGNTFTNIKSCAVQFANVINCTVSNNKITSSPRGIAIFGAVAESHDVYLATTLSKEGKTSSSTSVKYVKPASNMNIVITNNNIMISGEDPYATYERCGVYLSGFDAKSVYKSSSGDKMPKGNYYVSGALVQNNTVKGNSHGVKLVDVWNTKVLNNTLDFTGSIGKINFYGVNLTNATKSITISKNICNKHLNGIYAKDAGAGNITDNTIKDTKKYGISIERSSASTISGNTISNTKDNGIHISDKSKAKEISNNKITSAGNRGIYVGSSSKVTSKINGNTIKKVKDCGIHIWNKSQVKEISGNKITSAKRVGIYVGGKSKVTKKIKKNKFKSCKKKIFINKDSKAKK